MSGLARLARSECQSCGRECLDEELAADLLEPTCVPCHREHEAAGALLLQADFRERAHEWFAARAEEARYAWAEGYFGFRAPPARVSA